MNVQKFIATRRDGGVHSASELAEWASLAAQGKIPDYQIAAWLMAAVLRPLTLDETASLTLGMVDSGERLDLTGLPKPWVDKHSTGGVGDKTTIVLLPLLAACGLTCIKMSGRGLGITGGTVDKLSSIPGFRLDLSPEEMKAQAARIGLALTGQTPNLAPADKVFYALRDATATVASVPLIVSSILSKKIAGGAETIVLDVKAGSGAFMPTYGAATELATWLKQVGERCGLNLRVAITDMDQPLGQSMGNALEVREAAEVLRGKAGRFSELCVHLAGLTLATSGLCRTAEAGEAKAREAIRSGSGIEKAKSWIEAQGGKAGFLDDDRAWPLAPVIREVVWKGSEGYVARFDARTIGQAVVDLGGGRHKKEDALDLRVGIESFVEVGSSVSPGQRVAIIHAKNDADADLATFAVLSAVTISNELVSSSSLILGLM